MTVVDGYFYMMDEDQDALIVKTDDGTQAFTYPLDTSISGTILSLEHDGYNFWSLEDSGPSNMRIRRWYIHNYVCKLRTTFDFVETGSDKFQSSAFTVEHYHLTFSSDEAVGQSNISVGSYGSLNLTTKLLSGMTVVFGPSTEAGYSGRVEEFTVNSTGVDFININGTLSYAYKAGDPIHFYSNIWLFNNYYGTTSEGALYKISGYTGSVVTKYGGGAYNNIDACSFYDISSTVSGTSTNVRNSIAYIKATNLIFLNPDDLNNSFGSMSMDNLHQDLATVLPIYDVGFWGTNVYRLQRNATYYGITYTFANNTYNYQLSTLTPFITSISLRAEPAILPANGINVAQITAIVKDQFNQPIAGKLVYFTEDDPDGIIVGSNPSNTNAYGVSTTVYRAGTTAREVKITATAAQG
jgi:hypothetical protein